MTRAEKAVERVRRWRLANPERAAAQRRTTAARTYGKRWRSANPERAAAQDARRDQRKRERDPDGYRAATRERSARYRARRRGAHVERVDPRVVWKRDGGICGICREPADSADWHLDHVVPLARGGEHSYANVQVAHPPCNRRKWAHT